MMAIIDGDTRMPNQIAEDSGFMVGATTSDDVKNAVEKAIAENLDIVEKILVTGNDRPVMSLVGKVMRDVNRTGDPVLIKKLLLEQIAERRTANKGSNK
jgi:Asp-tRNA(Asn)/Glu-tRNA(Gln) amidotransferase B subunit